MNQFSVGANCRTQIVPVNALFFVLVVRAGRGSLEFIKERGPCCKHTGGDFNVLRERARWHTASMLLLKFADVRHPLLVVWGAAGCCFGNRSPAIPH